MNANEMKKLASELLELGDNLQLGIETLTETVASLGGEIEDLFDVDKVRSGLREALVSVYVELYTADEMQAMIDYLSSPHGASMHAKRHALKARVAVVSGEVFAAASKAS